MSDKDDEISSDEKCCQKIFNSVIDNGVKRIFILSKSVL